MGVVLVLGSLLVGARIFAGAAHTERIWAAAHDLAPGEVLRAADVRAVDVRLSSSAQAYFPAGDGIAGQTISRSVGAGELVARSSVGATPESTTVTIPLSDDNAPKIAPGDRITLWVSTTTCPSDVVLADVVVQDVRTSSGSAFTGGGEDVVARRSPQNAQRVVRALALDGAVLRAGSLTGGPSTSSATLPDLSDCVPDSS